MLTANLDSIIAGFTNKYDTKLPGQSHWEEEAAEEDSLASKKPDGPKQMELASILAIHTKSKSMEEMRTKYKLTTNIGPLAPMLRSERHFSSAQAKSSGALDGRLTV